MHSLYFAVTNPRFITSLKTWDVTLQEKRTTGDILAIQDSKDQGISLLPNFPLSLLINLRKKVQVLPFGLQIESPSALWSVAELLHPSRDFSMQKKDSWYLPLFEKSQTQSLDEPFLRQIIGPLGTSFEDEDGTAPDSICCLIELPIKRARRRQKDDHARLNIQKRNHSEWSVTSQFSSMHFFS